MRNKNQDISVTIKKNASKDLRILTIKEIQNSDNLLQMEINEAKYFLASIVESSQDSIVTINFDRIITSWNKAAEALYGHSASEAIGSPYTMLTLPKDLQEILNNIDKIKHSIKVEIFETVRKKKDGRKMMLEVVLSPVKDELGRVIGISTIARDVTEHRRLEEELKVRLSQQDAIVKLGQQALAGMPLTELMDEATTVIVETLKCDLSNIMELLPNKKELLIRAGVGWKKGIVGYQIISAAKDTIGGYTLNLKKPVIFKDLKTEKRFKSPSVHFNHGITSGFHVVILGGKGEDPYGILGACSKKAKVFTEYDTQFLQAVANILSEGIERKKIEERFRATWESSADAMSLSDSIGTVIAANSAYFQLYGYPAKEVIGKPFSIIFPKEFEKNAQAEYIKRFNGEYNPTPIEAQIIHKDGSKKTVEARYSFLMNEKKRTAMLSVIRDVTNRKELENHKDEFMGIVSHELKTPVTSLKAFAQVLQNRFKKEGNIKSAEYLAKMDAQINKLNVLIGDLLDVTKIEGGRLQFHEDFFFFDELVSEIIEEVQRTTTRHTLIKKGASKKTIHGDRERIGQVITNLLTNAIKYSPHSEKIVITTSSDKAVVTFAVKDYGVGISEEKQAQLFERFFRVSGTEEQTFPGLGLGLYISKEIIKRQGGKIWVESEKGKGSTFFFSLPINSSRKIKQQKNNLVEEEMKYE